MTKIAKNTICNCIWYDGGAELAARFYAVVNGVTNFLRFVRLAGAFAAGAAVLENVDIFAGCDFYSGLTGTMSFPWPT